jgi:RND superfamily putative drug exporter
MGRFAAAHPAVQVSEFDWAQAIPGGSHDDLQRAERLAVPVTLIVMLLAFGSLVAAALPVVLALTAVLGTFGLIALLSRVFPSDSSTKTVVLLIGMAVGVDYSLFYLRRAREEHAAGRSRPAALLVAAATSGRAVLLSGLTVVVALSGLYLAGIPLFASIATGTILVVAISVAGSLTVLPASISLLGDRIEAGRIPLLGRRRHQSRFWPAVVGRVLAHPWLAATLSVGILLLLAAPFLGLRTQQFGDAAPPRSTAVGQTYARIQASFPGTLRPAQVVIEAPNVSAPAVRSAIAQMRVLGLRDGAFHDPILVQDAQGDRVAQVSVPLVGAGTDAASQRALAQLRHVLALTVDRVARATVTGPTANSHDFNTTLDSHLPLVVAFVLGLAFLLLLVSFRSLAIPLVSIALNLLSVGAAYGILVLVFQRGYGHQLLGFSQDGPIVSWLPLFLFVILFGLSMDYHVFILSRIREESRASAARQAIARGVTSTAGIVTTAAVVMVAVFGVFGSLHELQYKQAGVGLAAAVLLDATIVRGVLLPATLGLLGERAWYLPRALSWLPRLDHEPAIESEPAR